MNAVPLDHAILYEANHMPGRDGKMTQLKGTLSTNSPEGKAMALKLTLMDTMVLIETKAGSGYIPLTAFKMLVPTPDAKNKA